MPYIRTPAPYVLQILWLCLSKFLGWTIVFAFSWAAGPLINLLSLYRLAAHWPLLKWIGYPLYFASFGVFWGCAGMLLLRTAASNLAHSASTDLAIDALGAILAGLIYQIVFRLEECFKDPDLQKRLAGDEAEKEVRDILNGAIGRLPETAITVIHGAVFVFNQGSDREYSVEIDHLVIAKRNVFVVETKYKSGTIHAIAGDAEWQVEFNGAVGAMHNALDQAKRAARIVTSEFQLPFKAIPVVAIVGHDVKIINGPGNVVQARSLLTALTAFDDSGRADDAINPAEIKATLLQRAEFGHDAKRRHIERIDRAARQADRERIVRTSSTI